MPGIDQEARSAELGRRLAARRNASSVPRHAVALPAREDRVEPEVCDNAYTSLVSAHKRNRRRDARKARHEVERSADRVDDPNPLPLADLEAVLLAKNRMIREALADALSEMTLDRQIRRRHDVERVGLEIDDARFAPRQPDCIARELSGQYERRSFDIFRSRAHFAVGRP